MNNSLYPIKFEPILQEKIWGGNKLNTQFNKKSTSSNVGESWELSAVKEFISIVANGNLKGSLLTDLIKNFRQDLLGKKVFEKFGENFPLLFKFIDATENLSIQLHPNDEIAKKNHNSFGKTEMWYVLESDVDSKLYAGFNRRLNKEKYLNIFNNGNILDVIHVDTVKKGDFFFIDAGIIHAIGKGIVIAEIQQTSDVTYRVYDWDRVDGSGIGRELHTNEAIEALDFSKVGTCRINFRDELDKSNNVIATKYFTTNKINLTKRTNLNVSEIDSFIVYMCVEGAATVSLNNTKVKVVKGETFLIPAIAKEVIFNIEYEASFLEVYID